MNIDNIKKQFPIFNSKVQNNDLVDLDSLVVQPGSNSVDVEVYVASA